MTRLPTIDFRTIDKILLHLGFEAIRQKGSHIFYRHPDGRTTTVPKHPGRDMARPLLREILKDIDISREQFAELLKKT